MWYIRDLRLRLLNVLCGHCIRNGPYNLLVSVVLFLSTKKLVIKNKTVADQ